MPREGEAVGDLQSVVDHQTQQNPLHQVRAARPLLLAVLDDLQHHLQGHTQIQLCTVVVKQAATTSRSELPGTPSTLLPPLSFTARKHNHPTDY